MDWKPLEDCHVKTRLSLAAALLCCASMAPLAVGADPWDVRRERLEGARNIDRERYEAAREIRRCQTRECVMRETREAQREVARERHEAHKEIRGARAWAPGQQKKYARYTPYYGNAPYIGNSRYNSNDRYGARNDWDGIAHYHPDGQYCREARHIAHFRDGYYRDTGSWYRDGRYWNESAYVDRYYGQGRNNDDDNDDLLRGIVIGAAVVGVIAAVHDANDDD
jgi:hypothetical protein